MVFIYTSLHVSILSMLLLTVVVMPRSPRKVKLYLDLTTSQQSPFWRMCWQRKQQRKRSVSILPMVDFYILIMVRCEELKMFFRICKSQWDKGYLINMYLIFKCHFDLCLNFICRNKWWLNSIHIEPDTSKTGIPAPPSKKSSAHWCS